jgi:hypothetical protein
MRQRHLRSQDQGTALIAVSQISRKSRRSSVFQWRHGEVVQQQNIGSGEPDQKAADTAVGMRYR